MLRVFNCGLGMILFVPPGSLGDAKRRLDAAREEWVEVGRVVEGGRTVLFS